MEGSTTGSAPLVWAEVDLGAVAANVRALRGLIPGSCRFMAVVKADGYGHGAAAVALTALKSGADCLGVARFSEGITLRRAGIHAPILVFGYTPPNEVPALLAHDLTQAVHSLAAAEAYSRQAAARGGTLAVHLKIDSGMGRLGWLPGRLQGKGGDDALLADIVRIARLPSVAPAGIFTHFAAADSADKRYSERQLEIFLAVTRQLKAKGISTGCRHAANSAATIDLPAAHLDMVRPGISIYGLYPSAETDKRRVSLTPAMTLKTRVIHLKQVPAGFKVSYGMTYATPQPTIIATVAIGYGDGYHRLLSSRGHMLLRGHRVPVVGRVCMDLTMLDVGSVPGAAVGDEVVVFGRQGGAEITADEVAAAGNTINYEVVTALAHRVTRIHLPARE